MLKIITGTFESRVPDWVQGKLTFLFDSLVEPNWLQDPIVREELLDVDEIADVNGLSLIKKDGSCIPVNWLSQGTKQFLFAVNAYDGESPDEVIDCYHVGWNVYKYFYKWCSFKNIDITLLMNSNDALRCDENMKGLFLNTCVSFSTNRELVDLIYENMYVLLSEESNNGIVIARTFVKKSNRDIFTGEEFRIDLKKGRIK